MNEKLYPLGTIVLLKGGAKKIMIIARALVVNREGKKVFFDYGGEPYPEGLTGDEIAYFNNEFISKVVYVGYTDVDDENVIANIERFLQDNPNIPKATL